MYRLLIIDNEMLIVDNLVDLFMKSSPFELEVHGVYTAASALELMSRTKIDIVLSDIRMPGMSGLELQQEINRQWPSCKIIFLSGYNDFEYVQQAIRHDSVDYLLKTEGEQKIIDTVGKAIRMLDEVLGKERLMEQAVQQMQVTRALLHKEYLWSVLQGESQALRQLQDKFEKLHIPLSARNPVMLAVGRVDDWRDDYSSSDRDLLLYAIRNIADEYWSAGANVISVAYDKNKVVWFIQPLEKLQTLASQTTDAAWSRFVRFTHGTAESIQLSCNQLLGLKLSLAIAGEPRKWRQTSEQFDSLRLLLNFGAGLGQEALLFDQEHVDQIVSQGYNQETRTGLKRLQTLGTYLENGERQAFFADFTSLAALSNAAAASDNNLRMEITLSLASIFIAYINRWGLHGVVSGKFDLNQFMRFDPHQSWSDTMKQFASLAECLFDNKRSSQEFQENDIVKHVQWYVTQHLSGDLSLTRIGEVVGHNPYYLSRLYKQITGENLSDYIAGTRLQKARELLAEQALRVSDISKLVGFLSEQSFYRFFKKATGITPQEYRDMVAAKYKRDTPK
jgi:Response regulator containing CheY-like receiver domain and AraC-type DNA-binding domain